MTRLEAWRQGKPGTVLFYSYLVSILIVATVVVIGMERVQNQSDALRHTVTRLDRQGAISCSAIHGAVQFWKNERMIVYGQIADQTVVDGARDRAQLRLTNLNAVIEAGDNIDCDGGS